MQDISKKWFTEECIECGTAFSLETHEKIHEEQTPFQKIEVYSTKSFGNLMVIDGFMMLTERDNFIYHEMMVHPALFNHANPTNVVVVGGGDCGAIREVAKHTCVQNITQVEIDQRVTQLSEKYFPVLCEANNDPRVELIFDDAIKWMQQAQDNSIDIIIVDSTDPTGPDEGLFSTLFYQTCIRTLKSDGILVQQSESPLAHLESIIKPMHACMRNAGFANTDLIFFPQPSYPTGWWTATMTSKGNQLLFSREAAAKQIDFTTQYYNHAIHIGSFAAPQFIKRSL